MDCSRTSLRHGAEHVTIVYRRTRSELVVDEEELGETEREGVRMEFLASPIEVLGEDGKVTGVRFIRNRLGEPDASGRRSPVPIEGSEFVDPGRHGHPGRLPGGRPHVPAGRGELRDQPRPDQGRPGDVRDERPRRLRLRRLRDRPDDADRGGRPRQEVRLRDRSLPVRPDRRDASRPTSRSPARGATRCPSSTTSCRASTSRWSRCQARMPSTDPKVNFTTPVELGYDANGGRRRVHALPDVQLQHLVRPLPVRAVRRLRRRLPRGRHPHGRRQPAEDRGPPARARGGLRLGAGRRR